MGIFEPYRAVRYITAGVPFSIQRLGTETFIAIAIGVGKAFRVYNCAKLSLVLVAGLDPIASTVVEDLIRSAHLKGEDALGKPGEISSYVVVTHQHFTIQRTVDRLIFLYEGKIVWEGMTHEFTSSANPIVQQVITIAFASNLSFHSMSYFACHWCGAHSV